MPSRKNTSKRKSSQLDKSRSRIQLLTFILLFAVIGSYFIWRSFATSGTVKVNAPVIAIAQAGGNGKYWIATNDGGIFSMGGASFYGSMGGKHLNQAITAMAATPNHNGYWLLGGDGGVYSFGSGAKYYGHPASSKVSGFYHSIVSTPSGNGYWIISLYGHILSFGDAVNYSAHGTNSINASLKKFNTAYGGLPGVTASGKTILSATASTSGYGLALLGKDGSIYAYGDMPYHGGPNKSDVLNYAGGNRAVSIINNGSNGYVVASVWGGVYAYNATYYGGGSGKILAAAYTPDHKGYWLAGEDGSIFAQGDAQYEGRIQVATHLCWDGKAYPIAQACPAKPASPTPGGNGGGSGTTTLPGDPSHVTTIPKQPPPTQAALCAAVKTMYNSVTAVLSSEARILTDMHDNGLIWQGTTYSYDEGVNKVNTVNSFLNAMNRAVNIAPGRDGHQTCGTISASGYSTAYTNYGYAYGALFDLDNYLRGWASAYSAANPVGPKVRVF